MIAPLPSTEISTSYLVLYPCTEISFHPTWPGSWWYRLSTEVLLQLRPNQYCSWPVPQQSGKNDACPFRGNYTTLAFCCNWGRGWSQAENSLSGGRQGVRGPCFWGKLNVSRVGECSTMKQHNEAIQWSNTFRRKVAKGLGPKPSGCDIWHQCRVVLNEAFTDAAFSP